jgi:hypothetical protein
MATTRKTQPKGNSEPAEETPEPAEETPEPLNRAERRAQQRGKKAPSTAPPGVRDDARGHPDQVQGQQRRAGRRGNR